MYCRYCGKQKDENDVCSCQQEVKAKKIFVSLLAIIVALIAVTVVCIVILARNNTPSDAPSIDESQNNINNNTNTNNGTNDNNPNSSNSDGNADNENNSESIIAKINPFDYIDHPDFDGYDGSGAISISINRDNLICAIIGSEPEDDNWEEYSEWLRNYYIYDEAIDDIKISYSKNNSLKNGDTVTVTMVMPELLVDKVENASKTYTVSGLRVIGYVEIFDDIRISYKGVSGQAFAEVERLSNSELLSSCRFEITPNGNLSNGDQITVSIANKDWLMELFNIVPKTLSKTFTVEGLSSYVVTAEQLPLEDIRKIAQQFYEDTKKELVYDGYFTYENVTYDGTYLYVLDEAALFGYKNILRMSISYKLYMHGSYIRTDTLYLDFTNLVIDPSGKVPISYEDGSTAWFDKVDYKETRVE